jgi:hypothetical protein
MRKIVLTYGIIAGIINAATATVLVTLAGEELLHANSEWIGYLVMIVSLSMIFIGVKQYRDWHLGGIISFGKAFLVGLYIALVAAAIYVISWEIYMQLSDMDFMETYSTAVIEDMRAEGAAPAEISEMQEQMDYFAGIYENPFYRVFITLSEILPVGLIITLISAFLLRKSSFMAAPENRNSDAQAI